MPEVVSAGVAGDQEAGGAQGGLPALGAQAHTSLAPEKVT